MVSEFDIQAKELVEACIHKLAIGVCDSWIEMARIQLELNLQISEL